MLALKVRWRLTKKSFGLRRLLYATVVDWIDHETSILNRIIADVCFAAEEFDALVMKELVQYEGDGQAVATRSHTRRAQFHLDSNVQSHEAFHPIQIPRVDVDVVDWGGENKNSVQLSDSMCRKIDADTVEQSMLQPTLGCVYANMED